MFLSNEYKDWERDKIEEENQIVAEYQYHAGKHCKRAYYYGCGGFKHVLCVFSYAIAKVRKSVD